MRWAADTTLLHSGPRCLLVNEPRRISRLLTGAEAALLRQLVHRLGPDPSQRGPLRALIDELVAEGFLEAEDHDETEDRAWRT
ncbi:MAG TPA: hypothetical protein PLU22_17380 [Polyangiaceae bacterium]|mgnify:CR=1 FL=1|nr:hypothetical protein [Polyangiaceae bacterium]